MWIEQPNGAIANMDWVSAIEVYYEKNIESPWQIRAYAKGSEGWYDFGVFATKEEAEEA